MKKSTRMMRHSVILSIAALNPGAMLELRNVFAIAYMSCG